MTAQEFTDLVLELNTRLEGNKYLENLGLCFSYHTNYYYDQIIFGEFPVFCSENDSLHDYDTNRKLTVKEVVKKNFTDYLKALKTIKLV